MIHLIALLVPFLITLGACGAFVLLAPRLGFTDRPGSEDHKRQARSVPYGGGVAVMFAAVCAVTVLGAVILGYRDEARWLLWSARFTEVLLPVGIGALALFGLGLWDDIRPMRARYKLGVQVAIAAGALSWAGLGVPLLDPWPWLSLPVAVFWTLALCNAYNLLDHADGLLSTLACISCAAFLSLALELGDTHVSVTCVLLLGALTGFWIWNCPPARIYMGDAGSLPVGYLLACCGLLVLQSQETAATDVEPGPLWVLTPAFVAAIPLYDMAVVIVKRWRRRLPLMKGDRGHIAHRLSRLGLRPWAALAVVAAMQITLAVCAMILWRQDLAASVAIVVQAGCVCVIALVLEAARDHVV